MKIYFVRHGHPDYKNDCLTELGIKQAQAAALRLKNCNIERVFSSAKGRAIQTAEHTAKMIGLEVIPCSFINEIGWSSINGEPIFANGQPWAVAEMFVSEGKSICDTEWQTTDPFCKSFVVSNVQTVCEGIDAWLADLGYQREGDYYRVASNETVNAVAMFSHAGSFSAALSHILNIPFPQVCGILDIYCTSITVIELSGETDALITPKIRILNDAKHTEGLCEDNVYGN